MRAFIRYIIVLLLLISCGNEPVARLEIDKPKNLLSESEMVEALTDISIIEGAYAMRYVQIVRYADVLAKDVEGYLAEKNISPGLYKESIRYYTTLPKAWSQIQEKVKLNIQEKMNLLPPAQVVPPEDAGTTEIVD